MKSNYINEYAGKAIRNLRQSKNLTLSEVAQRVRISYQQLQKYEKGVNRLSIDKLYEISKFLGIEVYNFFPGNGNSLDKANLQKMAAGEAFGAIDDEESRQIILKLMEKLAPKEEDSKPIAN
jgi:transcriptional regulator with XRE-family HTH domain